MSRPGQFWLSFCDTDLPSGQQFLGVSIVECDDPVLAVARAWEQGINPGGQVSITGPAPLGTWPEEMCNRLLTKEEALTMGEQLNA